MIIKFIPETEEEIQNYTSKGIEEIEHTGVREFMIFGNKLDGEGDLADFHEWHGSYRYLMGSLDYFYEMINDKRRDQGTGAQPVPLKLATTPPSSPMIKRGEIAPDIKEVDVSNLTPNAEDEGAFDEEEAQAVEVADRDISVEELEQEADVMRKRNKGEIKPQGLKILK